MGKIDSKGREHEDDCTFDEEGVRFPVCTCGTWPELMLNTVRPEKGKRSTSRVGDAKDRP